jgi:hypothetical protein
MPSSTNATRRDFLKATAAGAASVAMGSAASGAATTGGSRAPLAKSCIFINLVGGPSHLDTFDPKPNAPSDVRGPFRPIATNVPGIQLSELFPKLAAKADKFSLIRSMHHDAPPIHEAGFQLLNTGRLFRDGPEWPNNGSMLSYVRPALPSVKYPTLILPWFDINTGINVGRGLGGGWLSEQCCTSIAEVFRFYPSGVSGLPSRYGNSFFGQACAIACGALGAGNARFVTINQFSTVFDSPSWDCHADRGSLNTTLNDYRDTVAPEFDTAFAALLTDLEVRGLLESTLVVATGEFGRTPKLNSNGGRDHWAGCWTALVAGGGVQGGRVIGASDRTGSETKDRPVTPQELVATIFHALGVPADATIPGPDGSPVEVYPGKPVIELF